MRIDEVDPYVQQLLSPVAREQSAQVIQIDNGKAMIYAAIAGVALALSVWATWYAWGVGTEYRLLLQHVMKLEAQLEAESNGKR